MAMIYWAIDPTDEHGNQWTELDRVGVNYTHGLDGRQFYYDIDEILLPSLNSNSFITLSNLSLSEFSRALFKELKLHLESDAAFYDAAYAEVADEYETGGRGPNDPDSYIRHREAA